MKSKSIWFLWPLFLIPLAGGAIFLLFPKVFTGDFAEITIDSVKSPAPGEVEIRYRGRISSGTWIDAGISYREYTPPSRFPARPQRLEGNGTDQAMNFYTIRNDQGELATPEEVLRRMRVQAGRTYRIRPDRPLTLFRYMSFDGEVVERALHVGPFTSE